MCARRRVTAHQLVRCQLRGERRVHPRGDQRAGGPVFAAEEFTGLVNPVDQVTAFVRDERANLDLWSGQMRLDGWHVDDRCPPRSAPKRTPLRDSWYAAW